MHLTESVLPQYTLKVTRSLKTLNFPIQKKQGLLVHRQPSEQQRKAVTAYLNREGKIGSLSILRLIATESRKGIEQVRFSIHPSLKEGKKYQYPKVKII